MSNFIKMANQMANSNEYYDQLKAQQDKPSYDIKEILAENGKIYKELRSKRVK